MYDKALFVDHYISIVSVFNLQQKTYNRVSRHAANEILSRLQK